MRDAIDSRPWMGGNERISGSFGGALNKARAGYDAGQGDPLPLVARAMALVLAVSLSSLSIGAAIG